MRVSELVVPHDLTPLSDRALEAIHRLEISPQRVHVVHVLSRIDPNHPALLWSRDEDEPRRAHAIVSLHTRLAGGPFTRAQIHVRLGDPGSRIVELCKEVGAGLVALPSHGRQGLERFVFGSVAEHVARFAPCPVLVLPAASLEGTRAAGATAPASAEDADERIERLAVRVCDLVEGRKVYLSAVRVGLPEGEDVRRWEDALERRLGDCGIAFVDLSFTPIAGATAEILDARTEPLPEAP